MINTAVNGKARGTAATGRGRPRRLTLPWPPAG
jgi:hypothetical protein